MHRNISTGLNHINKDNSLSLNNCFLNIRDTVFSMVIDILTSDDQNSKALTRDNKIKTPNDSHKICNNKRLTNQIKSQVNQNRTYNRNQNLKLYKFFIKKDKNESICKVRKDKLYNINTINHTSLKHKNKQLNINNDLDIDKSLINNKLKKNKDKKPGDNNYKNNYYPKDKNNNIIGTSLLSSNINEYKLNNLKNSQKIHFYVTNILENIPNFQKKNNHVIKKENIDNNIKYNNNKMFSNTNDNYYKIHKNEKSDKYMLKKNKKDNSILFLDEKNLTINHNINRSTFNNYIESYEKISKSINLEHSNKNKSENINYNINRRKSTHKSTISISLNKPKIKINMLQKILFDLSNIKFRHLLIIFLDQKSIANLSSLNKTFYKNTRSFFFKNISKKLLAEGRDIYIKKIIRSVFKYSSFNIKNKSDFKLFYESMKYPNKKYNDIINNDLLRTFPEDINFNEGKKYHKILFNLLTCYSNYNKNIGYAQGLNFIFGNAIYLFSSEEDIFLFIDGFINFLKLENFLGINNQNNLPEKIKYISDVLEKYIPNIINVFNKKFVKIEIFLTNWMLTIFSCSMKRKNLIIIWCFMILFGWKFFYCLIIQILIQYQNIIFNLNEVDLCNKMKNILFSKEFNQNFDIIIYKSIDFMKDHIVL